MNKVFLIGNLTHDPELTETSSGTQVCRFSIAVNRNYTNADGERTTDFFSCKAWRGTAEAVARYSHKGNKLAVVGSLQNRSYEDKDGNEKSVTEIQVQDVEFLTPKGDNSGKQSNQTEGGKKPALLPLDDDGDIPF
jgi:single-strand DNA-binding protein